MAGFHLDPEQIDAWANAMLNEATDDMIDAEIGITPESLSAYFEVHYHLPFTPEEARIWLSEQQWYTESYTKTQ